MNTYIAWLNGVSVAGPGRLADVERKAREVSASENWRRFETRTVMKITRGSRQSFVKSEVLWDRNEGGCN